MSVDKSVTQSPSDDESETVQEGGEYYIDPSHITNLQTFPHRVDLKAVLPDEVRDLGGYLGTQESLICLSEIIGYNIEHLELEEKVGGRHVDARATCAGLKSGFKQIYVLEFQLTKADQNHLGKFSAMMLCDPQLAGGIWLAAEFSPAMIADIGAAQLGLNKPLHLVKLTARQGQTGFCIRSMPVGIPFGSSPSDQVRGNGTTSKGLSQTPKTKRTRPRGQSQIISDAKNARLKRWWLALVGELGALGYRVHQSEGGSRNGAVDKVACGIGLGTKGAKLHVFLRRDKEAIALRLDFSSDIRERLLPDFDEIAQTLGLTLGSTSSRGGKVNPTLLIGDISAPADATVAMTNAIVRKAAGLAQEIEIEIARRLG